MDGRPAAHVFVADLSRCALSDSDAGHLFGSLRLRPGELVSASDGNGRWRWCRVAGGQGPRRLVVDGPVETVERPTPEVAVGFALTKGGGPEQVVQRLSELGVDRLIPLVSARSVVRWSPARAPGHLERLRRVAREAAMQSRRVYLPEVTPLFEFADVVGRLPAGRAAMAHPGGRPISLDLPTVLVGPEGGWDPAELEVGLDTVDLGPTRLRTETAAMVAAALLCGLRSSLVAHSLRTAAPVGGRRRA